MDDKNSAPDAERAENTAETTLPPHKWDPVPTSERHHSILRPLGLAFFCFVASFLGSWLFLTTGLVKLDPAQTLDASREEIVQQEGEVVADVAKKVSPSVVSIVTQSVSVSPFGPSSSEGAGTGIIISKDGYIMTNKHVLPESATSVAVVTSDGTTYNDVKIIGRDPLNDIAFLKVSGVGNLKPANLGDSDKMQVGQSVVAIGNALGQFQNTVTTGIISGIGRPITASDGQEVERLEDLFQTDAAINPGNSGGPLVNLKGEVIAINTAVADQAEGVGFAIPINSTAGLIEAVLEDGKVERGYIGVRYVSLTAEIAKALNVSTTRGAYLRPQGSDPVVDGSPADKAGLRPGDIITKVDNNEVTAGRGLSSLLARHKPGDKVELKVLRDGREQNISVTLEQYPGS